jgi:hypothetical protein
MRDKAPTSPITLPLDMRSQAAGRRFPGTARHFPDASPKCFHALDAGEYRLSPETPDRPRLPRIIHERGGFAALLCGMPSAFR